VIKDLGMLTGAKIHVIAEDSIVFDSPCIGRFGLSMVLELESDNFHKYVLFDTNSASGPVLHNLDIFDISLDDISTIFLSHCHFDHTNGLYGILDALRRPIPVVAHPEIFRQCFEINPGGIRHIGITQYNQAAYEEKGAVFTYTRRPLNLMSGVVTTGEIERTSAFEHLEDLYTALDGMVVQDHELDDSAIILNFKEGLVILTGCCHAGIVNTIKHARKITGIEEIHAVIGGLHLIDADEEKLEQSISTIKEVDWVFAGHCTGFEGLKRISQAFGDRFVPLQTGITLHLPFSMNRKNSSKISWEVTDRYQGIP